MIPETYSLEIKMKNDHIELFPYARWNYNTKQMEIYNQAKDHIRYISFDEIEWFRKK